jgi:hypothetical protein
MELLKAKEAKEKSKIAQDKRIDQELYDIAIKIHEHTMFGRFYIKITHLSDRAIKELEELGYLVKLRKDEGFVVSWYD